MWGRVLCHSPARRLALQMPYGEYYAMKKKELGEKWDDNKILLSKSVRKAVGIMVFDPFVPPARVTTV